MGQAPVHALSVPHPGDQWSASSQCRWGKSPTECALHPNPFLVDFKSVSSGIGAKKSVFLIKTKLENLS